MIYKILRTYLRLFFRLFIRFDRVNNPELFNIKGPVLLASNHPNSFLDAVIFDLLFNRPVWSLARGDVFKKPFFARMLSKVNILPIYRLSESPEDVDKNYETFDICKELFMANKMVLIFSEGLCVNEWHLRPLKKGTARVVTAAWAQGIPVTVLPAGINYSSFRGLGKNVIINFGNPITDSVFDSAQADGKNFRNFNNKLQEELSKTVFEIDAADTTTLKKTFEVKIPLWQKILFFLPAMLGAVLHAPLYLPVKKLVIGKTAGTVHYDSVLLGILIVLYPLYVLLLWIILFFTTCSWYSLLIAIVSPLLVYSWIRLKPQLTGN